MASGKGAKIAKLTILLLLWCSPHFGSFGGRKSKNSRGPGNGFRKRSEYCEMDDVAAFVAFPSFRQLSAAGNPENPRGLEMGRRFCCFCGVPLISAGNIAKRTILLLLWGSHHFGSFRRPEIQKIQRALRGQKRPGRGQKQARRGQEEARKRPEEARKRPEEARTRPRPQKARNPEFGEKLLETQCFMNRK